MIVGPGKSEVCRSGQQAGNSHKGTEGLRHDLRSLRQGVFGWLVGCFLGFFLSCFVFSVSKKSSNFVSVTESEIRYSFQERPMTQDKGLGKREKVYLGS